MQKLTLFQTIPMTKLIVLLLFPSLVAFGQTTANQESGKNSQQEIIEWKTLDQSKFSIQYPSTWELNQSGQMGTSFIIFSPLENDEDKFKENVNLLMQDLTGQNIDLDKYVEISEGQIKTMLTNSTLIESTRVKKESEEFHKIIYSGDQGIFHLKFEQYYWVIDDKALVLTFTCETDQFFKFVNTGEKILNSFIQK
jgi:hypothetical protein